MEEKKAKKSGFFSLLNDSIQLRFYKRENFEQIGSFNLSPKSIYIAVSTMILVLLFLSFTLLAFTPLQRLIPRLNSIENDKKFIELSNILDDIEEDLDAQTTYNGALRKILKGEKGTDMSNIELLDLKNASTNLVATTTDVKPENLKKVITKSSHSIIVETGSLFDDMENVDFYAPVSGLISADFDPQLEHFGVDIIAPTDTPVKVIKDGHIIIAEWNIETGHTLGVQHDNNILSFYKHNSALLKEKGDFVKGGEIIAIIGNSGKLTTGPHLHFEIWHNGKPVNPNDYINLKNE